MNEPVSPETLSFSEFLDAMGEHLAELRKRLIISVLVLIVGVVIGIILAEPVMQFLCRPINGMENLTSIEVTENAETVFKAAMLFGFILSLPVIVYEALAFLLPALKENEKAVLFRFLPPLVIFFLLGVLFAYFVLLPTAIPFLTSFMGIRTAIRPSNYIGFVTGMIFWTGIMFEMPMVLYFTTRMHLTNSGMLLKYWREAVVICSIIAMVVTPTVDPVNMLILMVPLVLLYFVSILFAKAAERKQGESV